MAAQLRATSGRGGERTLVVSGRLDAESTAGVWSEALSAAQASAGAALVVDGAGIEYCDGTGAALLVALREAQLRSGGRFELRGLREDQQRLVELVQPSAKKPPPPVARASVLASLGSAALGVADDVLRLVGFVGEVTLALVEVARHPKQLRM